MRSVERNGRVCSRSSMQSTEMSNISNKTIKSETGSAWHRLRPEQGQMSSSTKLDSHFSMVLQTISESIAQNEMRLIEQDRRDAIKLQWQQVAVVVDRLLMFLFVSLTVGITLGLTLQGLI